MSVNVSNLARFSGMMAEYLTSGKHSLIDCLTLSVTGEENGELREVVMQIVESLKSG